MVSGRRQAKGCVATFIERKTCWYTALEKELGIQVYFADSYSSWQRGSNENGNGLFHEFFPKKTNFDEATANQVNRYSLQLINSRPRKFLGWETAYEVLQEELPHLLSQIITEKAVVFAQFSVDIPIVSAASLACTKNGMCACPGSTIPFIIRQAPCFRLPDR